MMKPDAVRRGLVGEAIARFERAGLRLVAVKALSAARDLAEEQYGEEIADKYGAQVRDWLIDYMSDGVVVPMVLEGQNCVQAVRTLAGDKASPSDCPPGTIRRDFCTDSVDLAVAEGRALHNVIHTSDSAASAVRETRIWFGADISEL